MLVRTMTNHPLSTVVKELTAQATVDHIDQLAVGAAIIHDGKLLLVTRADDEDVYPRHVELPGGSVDAGEDPVQAVEREMKEETGLAAREVGPYLGSFDYTLSDGRIVRQFNFRIEPSATDVRLNPREHSAFVWWDMADRAYLDSILITPLMKECVVGIAERMR